MIKDRKEKSCALIDMSVPSERNVSLKKATNSCSNRNHKDVGYENKN